MHARCGRSVVKFRLKSPDQRDFQSTQLRFLHADAANADFSLSPGAPEQGQIEIFIKTQIELSTAPEKMPGSRLARRIIIIDRVIRAVLAHERERPR